MKLIDLLVQELPKRGGWPEGAIECCRHHGASSIDFYDETGNWGDDCYLTYGKDFAKDCIYEVTPGSGLLQSISRSEYEAALAASKKEWDGEGLPPIGSNVSFFYNERYDYHKEIIPEHGQELEVVAHKTTTDGHDVAVCYWDKRGGGMAVCLVPGSLLPIRSEADKKRDDAIQIIAEICRGAASNGHAGELVYEAISTGKITGVKLED